MKENDFSKQDIYNIGFAVADAVRDSGICRIAGTDRQCIAL